MPVMGQIELTGTTRVNLKVMTMKEYSILTQNSRTGASPPDAVQCHTHNTLWEGVGITLQSIQSEYSKPYQQKCMIEEI